MKTLKPGQLERFLDCLKLGNIAVKNAQEANRKHGIPNWYSINGVIISDQQLGLLDKQQTQREQKS